MPPFCEAPAAFVDQRLGDLRFALYDSALPRSLFRVFAEERVSTERYAAEIWVVGSSHVCRFRAEGASLTETLTCADGFISPAEPVAEASDLSHAALERRIGPLSYRIEICSERSAARLDLPSDPPQGPHNEPLLEFAYPSGPGALPRAVTRIEVPRVEPRLLELRTYHSYPQEGSAARARTVIRVDRP